jgi:tetratricopeptide (TPR) repeat protein
MKYALVALLACAPTVAIAQQHDHKGAHPHAVLGAVNFANSGSAAAQPSFQRGVALLHSFEYADAAEAFREAQQADPALALAYWLEAFTYSHVVWGEEDLPAARAVLARMGSNPEARLARAKTPHERAFGAAIEAFFAEAPLPARTRALADSMAQIAARAPADHEAHVFAALSSMLAWFNTSGADREKYFQPVQQHALRVFRENPKHPGAAHYLIHFVDMNPRAAKDALEFARAYDKIAPDAEHALHMPSHVYLPLGLWTEVASSNERAWPAARREVLAKKLSPAENSWHSLDWLQYAYLQLGRDRDARALVDTARNILRDVAVADDNPDARNVVNGLAFRYGMETGKWDAYPSGAPNIAVVLGQPRPNQRSWGMATTAAYQAAVAALKADQDVAPAQKVIQVFRAGADSMPAEAPRRVPLKRLATQLEAMVAHAQGDTDRAITLLREIAPNEPTNASLPPTTIPSYELLGEYLLAAGRTAEAREAYQKALDARPNRAVALRGLKRAEP